MVVDIQGLGELWAAEDLCKRTLGRNENNKKKGFSLLGREKTQTKKRNRRKTK